LILLIAFAAAVFMVLLFVLFAYILPDNRPKSVAESVAENVQQRLDADKDIAVLPLLVMLPHEEFDTGYGVLWPMANRLENSHYD